MSKYDYLHALYQALVPLNADERNKIIHDIENRFSEAEETGEDELSVTNALGSPSDYARQFLQNETEEIIDINNESSNNVESAIIRETHKLKDKDGGLNPNLSIIKALTVDYEDRLTELTDRLEAAQKSQNEINDDTKVDEIIQPTHYNEQLPEKRKVYTSPLAVPKKQVTNNPIKMLSIGFGMLMFNAIFTLGFFIGFWATIVALVATGVAITISGLAIIISGLFSIPMAFMSVPLSIMNHPILLFSFGFLLTGIGGLLTIAMIYITRVLAYVTVKYASWNLKVIRGY
jgi:uncharacterized membrane protein